MKNTHNILLTIDVEDWFQVENLRPWFPAHQWEAQPFRAEHNTNRLLDLFDSFNYPVKVTFFVLGWIAQRYPELVRRIQARGHEVASHGHGHLLNYQMDKITLQNDLKTSKVILEDIIGAPVLGYRAPNFSISQEILPTIAAAGYAYDSSYNSFQRHGRYGTIDTDGRKHYGIAFKADSNLLEVPISNLQLWGQTVPWGGGGYFRLMPYLLFRMGIKNILKQQTTYVMYLHPWEIDPDQPRVKQAKGQTAFRHYNNLAKTYPRLRKLIQEFGTCHFKTCSQYIDQMINVECLDQHTLLSVKPNNDLVHVGL